MEAFVYCWTDHANNKLYIGSHKGSEDDGYVCSSKEMLIEYKLRPDDFTRTIIASGINKDIRQLEYKLLSKTDAKNDDDFYNLSNGPSAYYVHKHTNISKEKISKALKNRVFSEEHKLKVSLSKKGKSSLKLKQINKGRKHTIESRKNMSNSHIGHKHTEESKRKLSEALKASWIERKQDINVNTSNQTTIF
jgi:hypothetical protein